VTIQAVQDLGDDESPRSVPAPTPPPLSQLHLNYRLFLCCCRNPASVPKARFAESHYLARQDLHSVDGAKMGNICSKSSNQPENFSTPGRTLGSSSQTPKATTTPVPKKVTTSTPGRTLGGRDEAPSPDDARQAAARAAEVSLA
jgi:hypothetical protein